MGGRGWLHGDGGAERAEAEARDRATDAALNKLKDAILDEITLFKHLRQAYKNNFLVHVGTEMTKTKACHDVHAALREVERVLGKAAFKARLVMEEYSINFFFGRDP